MTRKIHYHYTDTSLIGERMFYKHFNISNDIKLMNKIGQGNFATCFSTNINTVIKTNLIKTDVNIDRAFDGQIDWLLYTNNNIDSHSPIIYDIIIYGNYYVTHMERLTALPSKYIDNNVTSLIQSLNRLEPLYKLDTKETPYHTTNPLYASLKSCYNALYKTIEYNIKNNKSISLDINKNNLCYRGNINNLIILDPFWKKYAT